MAKCKCLTCNNVVKPQLKGNALITLILLFWMIIPGIIYMIWRRSGNGICPICKSTTLVKL